MEKSERMSNLQAVMKQHGIDFYYIGTNDYHHSEYVSPHFQGRAYISGFTGSAGSLLVEADKGHLWTDGRYFIQAEQELKDTKIQLQKQNEEGVPTIEEYLENHLQPNQVFGADGRCISIQQKKDWEKICEKKGASFRGDLELLDFCWENRPDIIFHKIWELNPKTTVACGKQRISALREKIKEKDAQGLLLTDLCDIAWLFQLRGNDISSVPVFFSYCYITLDEVVLYVDLEAVSLELKEKLESFGVELKAYGQIYEDLSKRKERVVWICDKETNSNIEDYLPDFMERIFASTPVKEMKCIKSQWEIEQTKVAHKKDGVAMVKFMYWLSQQDLSKLTENDVRDYLDNTRKQQENFIELSFDTICAYGANAAMMHYSCNQQQRVYLQEKSFLLIDSGGHYKEGTTDVTRTFGLGELTYEEKLHYTKVLQGHIKLAMAIFPKGCTGQNLDVLARGPLWQLGKDYRCGTGHGVGHVLSVHEGPNSFRQKMASFSLEPGMITTDEPGYYQEQGYGIRIENELLCVDKFTSEYGTFYGFEPITYVPVDKKGILKEELSQEEIDYFNRYHKMVFETLQADLTSEECKWLQEVTAPL